MKNQDKNQEFKFTKIEDQYLFIEQTTSPGYMFQVLEFNTYEEMKEYIRTEEEPHIFIKNYRIALRLSHAKEGAKPTAETAATLHQELLDTLGRAAIWMNKQIKRNPRQYEPFLQFKDAARVTPFIILKGKQMGDTPCQVMQTEYPHIIASIHAFEHNNNGVARHERFLHTWGYADRLCKAPGYRAYATFWGTLDAVPAMEISAMGQELTDLLVEMATFYVSTLTEGGQRHIADEKQG